MKKLYAEILFSSLFVAFGTIIAYNRLADIGSFWDAQMAWNVALALGWVVVALGYFNQGWLVRESKSARHVSVVLPVAVLLVQCILFVKGIYYNDWSLVVGAVMVNSGVVFSLYQITRARALHSRGD